MALAPDDPRHGTTNAYNYHFCRCAACREAVRGYMQTWKLQAGSLEPDDPRHGTYTGYTNWDCRCNPCREAESSRAKMRYRARKAAR